jgi:hypothetical protein
MCNVQQVDGVQAVKVNMVLCGVIVRLVAGWGGTIYAAG